MPKYEVTKIRSGAETPTQSKTPTEKAASDASKAVTPVIPVTPAVVKPATETPAVVVPVADMPGSDLPPEL